MQPNIYRLCTTLTFSIGKTHVYCCFFKYLNPCKFLHILFWYNMISNCIGLGSFASNLNESSYQHLMSFLKKNKPKKNKKQKTENKGPCCNHIASEQNTETLKGENFSKWPNVRLTWEEVCMVFTPIYSTVNGPRKKTNKTTI